MNQSKSPFLSSSKISHEKKRKLSPKKVTKSPAKKLSKKICKSSNVNTILKYLIRPNQPLANSSSNHLNSSSINFTSIQPKTSTKSSEHSCAFSDSDCQIISQTNHDNTDQQGIKRSSETSKDPFPEIYSTTISETFPDISSDVFTEDSNQIMASEFYSNLSDHDTLSSLPSEQDVFEQLKNFSPFKYLSLPFDHNQFHRFKVLSISNDLQRSQLSLQLKHAKFKQIVYALLSGQWYSTLVSRGDVVNIKSDKFDENTFYINNEHGFIVINPDILITSTLLSSSVFCLRKAWLSDKFKGWGFGNKAMVVGTIVHQLFQKACTSKFTSLEELENAIEPICCDLDLLVQCLAVGLFEKKLLTEVYQYTPHIIDWLNKYFYIDPKMGLNCMQDDPDTCVQVLKVHDIEDNIWCPGLGMKGKVDASVEVEIHDKKGMVSKRKQLLPLELKTGRASFSFEHQGQVTLYSLMMKEREADLTDGALLLYLKEGPKMRYTQAKRPVQQALIQSRNELAVHLNQVTNGPPIKNTLNPCSKCDHLLDCSLMVKCFQPKMLESSRVMADQLVPSALGHLCEEDLKFFHKWMTLIFTEINESKQKNGTDIAFWTESSKIRESKGLGLAKLVIKEATETSLILVRIDHFKNELGTINKLNNKLLKELVALSVDQDCDAVYSKIALAIGFVIKIDDNQIEISLDKKFNETFLNYNLRLDVMSSYSSYTVNFDNLLRLMSDGQVPAKLRNLIIQKRLPQFEPTLSKQVIEVAKKIIKPLNIIQQKAVLKSIQTQDYLLIRGTPGSGKTSIIVAIVRMLSALKKSVLITSHTHAAVDNILCKLKDYDDVQFVRFGSMARIHQDIKQYSINSKMNTIQSIAELKVFYASINVAAVTCLAVSNYPFFEMKQFDYCIIDEATQVLLPISLGPLFNCNKFILVGDDKQLPPVVQSLTAKSNGLSESLFALLLNQDNLIELTIQYRMNCEIMRLANDLFYNNLLSTGSKHVDTATLSKMTTDCDIDWLNQTLNTHLSKSVVFLNTSEAWSAKSDDNDDGIIVNHFEAATIKSILNGLLRYFDDIKLSEVGIITPFQKQVSVLHNIINDSKVMINSVDQYQGKEKSIIIISCVKSCHSQLTVSSDEILSDERRLNVAITRAIKKLIIVGNKSTLLHYQSFQKLFNILRKDQFVDLPQNVRQLANNLNSST